MASLAMMYNAAILASVADDMTYVIIIALLRMGPLVGGIYALLERKRWPPAWLWACGSLG